MEDSRIEKPTDVLVRITTTNICGSDLHMYEGRTPLEEGKVLGHENQGEIIEVGSGASPPRLSGRSPSTQVAHPPEIGITCPARKSLAAVERANANSAASLPSPSRPAGMFATNCSRTDSSANISSV